MLSRRLPVLAALVLGACSTESPAPLPDCPDELTDASAVASVAGTYRYTGGLVGTITFEQDASRVRLVSTTYENADDRPLVGEGELVGNRLDMVLVPENGDTDYEARVTFLFDATGDRFCVAFDDTNGDRGAMGSYVGRRR